MVRGLDLSFHPAAASALLAWGARPFACLEVLGLKGCGLRGLPVVQVCVGFCVCGDLYTAFYVCMGFFIFVCPP